jgi:hypothetical protein
LMAGRHLLQQTSPAGMMDLHGRVHVVLEADSAGIFLCLSGGGGFYTVAFHIDR